MTRLRAAGSWTWASTLFPGSTRPKSLRKTDEIFRVFFFRGENVFQETPGRGIAIAEELHHLTVALDRNSLCDEVFADHVFQGVGFDVFRMAALSQARRRKVRVAAQFGNAGR